MRNHMLHLLAIACAISPAIARAQAPRDGVVITEEDVKAVLQHAVDTKRTTPDNTIRVIDMGAYQLGVAVIHRGKFPAAASTGGGANAQPGRGDAGRAPAGASQPACGEQRPGEAVPTGPTGIFHDDTAETYIVISGTATLITGGTIVNGRRAPADGEVATILNGPSCNGTMVGYTSRDIKVGDVIVIPEGVPHGFSAVPDHVTYLSVRPDLKKVLQHGYVNPALKK